MQKKYGLYNPGTIEGEQILVAEIAESYVALVLGCKKKITGFEFFESHENDLDELLEYVKHNSQLLDSSYDESKIYSNSSETVLIPVGQFSTAVAEELIDVTFGRKPNCRINVENINFHPGIVNVYRSDERYAEVISKYFRAGTKRHLLSKLIEIAKNDTLHVQFYSDSMIIVVKHEKHLQLARKFALDSEDDALYHLLNVCKQSSIDPSEVILEVSGFISDKSRLMLLLKQYFTNIVISKASDIGLSPEELEKYPLHYFTPFFNLLA